MGFKRKPSASLRDLVEGQPGKVAPGKSQPKLPPPSSKPKPLQTRSSSALPPPTKLPPTIQPTDPKRKRSVKGKEPMDRGRSHTSQEEDEGQRPSKHLRVTPQGQEKEVDAQPKPQAWLPTPMLHGEPLMDNTSLRDFDKGEGTYPKRKRSVKGKEPMDRGRSRTSQEEDEGQQASKHLRVTPQGQEKEVDAQPKHQAWLPAPMLHGEPLMDNTSLSDFNKGEGTYVADVLERSLLLPIDMANLKNLRRQELFLSMKRYLGMVRFLALAAFQVLVSWFLIYTLLISNGRLFKLPIEWRRWPMTRAGPWTLSVKSVWMPRRPLRTPRPTS